MKLLSRLSLLGALVLGLAPNVVAQSCFGPDGFDGPCCAVVTENLPAFPPLFMDGSALSWQNCLPQPKDFVSMTLSAPVQTSCGAYSATLSIKDAAGITFAFGTLELTYSRTWDEIDPSGLPHQVYRFIAKSSITTGPSPAPIPNLPNDDPSFYYGYLDYAYTCNVPTPTWDHALVLFHNCDEFLHRPVISADPGVYDPARVYALVAPDNTLQPFDHAAIPPALGGFASAGAMRDPEPLAFGLCLTRDPVQGSLTPIVSGCACPLTLTLPPRNTATRLTAFASCGGGALSIDLNPLGYSWLDMVSTAIGRWTNPAVYPGQEGALVFEGPMVWRESCTAQLHVEFHYGGATVAGWTRWSPPPIVPGQRLYDTCSNWSIPLPGPIAFPWVGAVFPSSAERHVLYMDLP